MSSGPIFAALASRDHEARRPFLAITAMALGFCVIAWTAVIVVAVTLL